MKHRKNPPKRNPSDARVSIQLPKELLEKFKKRAKSDDRSLSSWMRHVLTRIAKEGEANSTP